MDTEINKIYTYFIELLDNNRIDYSISDFGSWKTIFIDANKNDIKSSQVEVDFSTEGIKVKYFQENQERVEIPVGTIGNLIETVSDITKIKIQREYTDFKKLLDANRIDYSVANFGVWKTIIIEPKNIEGFPVEVDFSAEGIKVKYYQENQEMVEIPVGTIDRLIETVSDITKIDIKKTEKNTNSFDEVERGARIR